MENKKFRKAVAAAVVGNILEWYDFVLYAFFALYISRHFFVAGTSSEQVIKTFMIYGAAFVARPLGAVILGAYGDKAGRKNALSLTIIIMALGIALIAFSSSAKDIGIAAPIILLVARLLQGFSAGGEIGSATAFLLEYAPENKKSFYASLFQSCMGIAAVLGSLVGAAITFLFDEATVFAWAWRVPFIIGLSILPVGIYIRKAIEDTPEFLAKIEATKGERTPIKDIVKYHKKPLLVGISFSLLWTVCPYVFVMFLPTYFMQSGFDKNHVYIASLAANLCMAVVSPIVGTMADKYGMKRVLTVSIIVMAFGNFAVMWYLFGEKTLLKLVLVHSGFLSLVSLFIGVAPAFVSRIFPVSVRASGISISYNVASVLTGFTPAFLASVVAANPYAPVMHVAIFCIPALIAIYFAKKSD